MQVPFKNLPTFDYQTGVWSKTSFSNQEAFAAYLKSLFKEPGEYEFDECTKVWNVESISFMRNKRQYCKFPRNTKEYIEYWNTQKERCRKGVIFINGDKQWYVTREYYMLLNFLPIINKEKNNTESFCDVRDVQYHIALYEKLAEASHRHGIIIKKRQMMSSFFHAAKMINVYWFEKKAILRNLAGDESYLTGEKGLWNYYNGYRDFLNENTAWYRNNSPNSDLKWIQRIETFINGKRNYSGRKSVMTGTTFKRSPTAGVGGPAYYNYFEEAGTFRNLDKTYLYMKPQLESGAITTGFFIGAGSVGELKDCKPLRKFIESPEEYGFMGIENTWVNKDRIPKITGLYIPEQWGMPPFIDVWGNSRVEEALAYLNADYGKKEKEMDAEDYQLHISQHPRYMEEAFAYREVSKWPLRKIEKRMQFLKDTPEIHPMKVELDEDEKGMVTWKMSDKQEVPYPTPKRQEDKEGVALMFAPPDSRYKHYAGVDTIETGKTTTSDSLFSIYIHRGISRVIYTDDEGIERTREEGIKLVFSWTGRFSTLEETNKYGELCMRLYEAMSLVERNKENFINHCIRKGIGTKYLLKEKELPFNKEMDFSKQYSGDEYGIYMDPSRKKQERIESYGIEYLNQELDAIYKKDKNGEYTAEKFKTYTGVEKIDDYWLLEELKHGVDDNTDRKQAWLLSITAAKTFEVQGFISTIRENRKDKPIKKVRPARSLLGGSFRIAITTKNKRLRSLLG